MDNLTNVWETGQNVCVSQNSYNSQHIYIELTWLGYTHQRPPAACAGPLIQAPYILSSTAECSFEVHVSSAPSCITGIPTDNST